MAVIRCRECRGYLARLAGRIRVLGTIRHSDDADEDSEVVRCGSCGTVHEFRRLDGEAA